MMLLFFKVIGQFNLGFIIGRIEQDLFIIDQVIVVHILFKSPSYACSLTDYLEISQKVLLYIISSISGVCYLECNL